MSDAQISSDAGASAGQTSSAPQATPQAQSTGASEAPKSLGEKIQAMHAAKQAESSKGAASTSPAAARAAGSPSAAAQVAEAQEVDPQVNQPVSGTEATPGELDQAAKEAYKAKLKFVFKGQEKDIPEMFHALMKDAETERQIHELFEKSQWFEETKPAFLKQSEQLQKIQAGLGKLDEFIARDPQTNKIKDFGRFANVFGLTDDDIFNYATERLQYYNMPDDQRARVDAEREAVLRAQTLEEQNEILRQQAIEFDAQTKQTQLLEIMKQPQIASIAQGHPGGEKGFFQAVAQNAWVYESQTGQALNADQAVYAYIQRFGLSAPAPTQQGGAPAQAQMAPAQAGMQPAAPIQVEQAPTLPRVPSQGTSPTKKVVTSMKDLHKRRAELEAQNG